MHDLYLVECTDPGPRPVYAATDLSHSGDTTSTSSDLTFAWTHDTSDATESHVPARSYQVTVSDGTNTLLDQTYPVGDVCTEAACSVTETLNFISEGEHTYTVTALNPDDISTQSSATFAFDLPTAPVLTDPGAQTSVEGETVNLQLTASDPDMGDTLTWAAVGLPPSLNLDQTGLVSGTVDTGAAASSPYSVTITVTDSTMLSDDVIFTWTVLEPGALVGDPGRIYPAHEQVIDSASEWPRFSFAAKDGASWYNLWIGGNGGSTALYQWYEAAMICESGVCTVPVDLWLGSDDYAWWMTYWGESLNDYGSYWNDTTFSVDMPAPALPTNLGVADTTASNPQFRWDASANALWYHVILAPADFSWVYDMGWHTSADLTCSDGCDYTNPVLDGVLASGDYLLYVAAWGPGGMSTGGVSGTAYAEGTFTVSP